MSVDWTYGLTPTDNVEEWVPPDEAYEDDPEALPDPPRCAEPEPHVEGEAPPAPDPDIDAFLNADEPEYDWAVPGLLEHGDRLILTGVEGGGKSTLLRQMAVQLAAGIHPFTLDEIDPLNVLLLDLENSARQVRRKIRPLRIQAKQLDPANLRVRIVTQGLNLTSPIHQEWLEGRILANRPQVLVTGPVYKLSDGDPNDEKAMKPVATFLDHLRARHQITLILEAHSPHAANGGRRPERPSGWSGWMRWPEFGLHLSTTGHVRHWRGDRDERDWPPLLQRGGEWPWTIVTDKAAVTFAAILAATRDAGEELSRRDLAVAIGTSKSTVDRIISANQRQYDETIAAL